MASSVVTSEPGMFSLSLQPGSALAVRLVPAGGPEGDGAGGAGIRVLPGRRGRGPGPPLRAGRPIPAGEPAAGPRLLARSSALPPRTDCTPHPLALRHRGGEGGGGGVPGQNER